MENSRFDLNSDANQLSLEQFAEKNKALETVTFTAKNFDFDDNRTRSLYFETPDNLSEKKSSKFFALSVGFHLLAVVGMSFLAIPIIEKQMNEVITIELESAPVMAPPLPPLKGSLAGGEIEPAQKAPVAKAAAPAESVKASTPIKASAPKAAAPAPKISAVSTVDKTEAFVPNIPDAVPIAASIEDISAPDLDDTALKNSSVGEFDSHELANDFESVDKAHQKVAAQEAAKMEAMADQLSSEQQQEIEGIKNAQAAENARVAALNKGRRSGELAALAGNEGKGADTSTKNKKGGILGDEMGSEEGQIGGKPNGQPTNVRKLENLRQMPGNIPPTYSREEIKQGVQGTTIFMAYITKAGVPTDFRLIQSTKSRTLDGKTFAALKKWRFYPGQEGWVEMPYEWTLRGDAVEDRAKLGENNIIRQAQPVKNGLRRTGN